MIRGAHFLLYTNDPDADRAFCRDVLGFRPVDAGGGWLIFALPPAELAFHPAEGSLAPAASNGNVLPTVLYLMCDDVATTVKGLTDRGVPCAPIEHARWGRHTLVTMPSGGKIGLYQPSHPTAIAMG